MKYISQDRFASKPSKLNGIYSMEVLLPDRLTDTYFEQFEKEKVANPDQQEDSHDPFSV